MNTNVALSMRQFVEAWKHMCAGQPGYRFGSETGLELVFSGLPIPFFNVAFATTTIDSADQLTALANQARQWAVTYPVPWFFTVTSDVVSKDVDVAGTLARCEMAPVMNLTGMMAEDIAALDRTPASLELVRPRDEATCSAMMEVNGEAYGMGPFDFESAMSTPSYWEQHFPVVGKVDGNPVTCSAVVMVEGRRYVAFVATHPDHRRHGYADAAMRHSLDLAAAAHGRVPTVLHATDAGRPVYARMGYQPIATHAVFMETKYIH